MLPTAPETKQHRVWRICIKLRFRSKQLSICNHWQTLIIAKENTYGKLIKWMLRVKITNLLPVAFRDVSSQFSCGRVLQCTSRLGNELLCCLAESIKMKLKNAYLRRVCHNNTMRKQTAWFVRSQLHFLTRLKGTPDREFEAQKEIIFTQRSLVQFSPEQPTTTNGTSQ